jgi:hypothetical protein
MVMISVMIAVMLTVAVVVMIIPVAVRMPAVGVFVPPPMFARPAVLAGLAQFSARAICLSTLPAVAFNSHVQPLIGSCDAPLASPVIGVNHRRTD